MSSNRSTPLGFEQSLWAHPDSVTHVEGISSDFVSTMVDEFLQLDTMKDANVSLRSFGQNKQIFSCVSGTSSMGTSTDCILKPKLSYT
jgi:hypothetical protein